jgi:hypothetical protein
MIPRILYLDGIGFWATGLPDWPAARAAFLGEPTSRSGDARRPSPALLPPAERRRAPDSVVLALEVAAQAIAQSGMNPADVPTVFASAHGDTAITDYMCSTLVEQPALISPTKFHNSVHNAAAGYWTIGARCTAPSSALTAFDCSFAAGFVEAATQSAADACPVLLVGYDIEASGALASVTTSRGLLAVALVLSPMASKRTVATIAWTLQSGFRQATQIRSDAARRLQRNASANALPLFESLARGSADPVAMPVSSSLALNIVLNMDVAAKQP